MANGDHFSMDKWDMSLVGLSPDFTLLISTRALQRVLPYIRVHIPGGRSFADIAEQTMEQIQWWLDRHESPPAIRLTSTPHEIEEIRAGEWRATPSRLADLLRLAEGLDTSQIIRSATHAIVANFVHDSQVEPSLLAAQALSSCKAVISPKTTPRELDLYVSAVDHDVAYVHSLAARHSDSTLTSPSLAVGPLWPNGAPQWWPTSNPTGHSVPTLQLEFTIPSDLPRERVDAILGEILIAASEMHATMGGHGLRLADVSVEEGAPALIPAGCDDDHGGRI